MKNPRSTAINLVSSELLQTGVCVCGVRARARGWGGGAAVNGKGKQTEQQLTQRRIG